MTGALPFAELSRVEANGRMRELRNKLLNWGRLNRRTFWWRDQRDLYTTAVVEILLKQTRAEPVVELAASFLRKYPSPDALGAVDLPVLETDLEPFGLYRQRARHLQALGRELVDSPPERWGNSQFIRDLPGIGSYAEGAIRCFVYGESVPIIDVNIARIMSRVLGISANRGELRRNKEIVQSSQHLLRTGRPRELNWALLDFGALICVARRPKCQDCPLNGCCHYRSKEWT